MIARDGGRQRVQLVIARRRLHHQPQSRAGESEEQHGDGQPPILCGHRPQPQPTQRHHERGGVGRQRQIEPQPVVPLRAGDPPEIGDERRHRQMPHGSEDRRRERDQIVVDRRKTGGRGEIGVERQSDQQRAGGDDQLGSHDRHEAHLPGEALVARPAQLVERDGQAETERRIPAEIEAQQRGQPQRQARRKEPAPPPGCADSAPAPAPPAGSRPWQGTPGRNRSGSCRARRSRRGMG